MDNVREIVNGGQLNGFIDKKVSITGFVTETASNGLWFDLRAADNELVKISLKRPLDKPLEGYVEVGTSRDVPMAQFEYFFFRFMELLLGKELWQMNLLYLTMRLLMPKPTIRSVHFCIRCLIFGILLRNHI